MTAALVLGVVGSLSAVAQDRDVPILSTLKTEQPTCPELVPFCNGNGDV
jgi:hypothetical protein